MNLQFEGQVVVVTGAARGIGAAVARNFAASGAKVIALDIIDSVVDLGREIGGEGLVHDITSSEAWTRLDRHIRYRYGRLDSLVNNAATEGLCRMEDLGIEKWNHTMAVNVTGTFLGCQMAVRLMRDNPGQAPGSIVNVGSMASQLSVAYDVAYTASKGAVVSLTRAVAHYCAREKLPIRANCVSPGGIATDMLKQFIASTPDPGATQIALDGLQPVGHLGTPENIADTVVYLASSRSGFITGSDIVIDGGASSAARL